MPRLLTRISTSGKARNVASHPWAVPLSATSDSSLAAGLLPRSRPTPPAAVDLERPLTWTLAPSAGRQRAVGTAYLTTLQEKLIEIGAKGEGVVIGVESVTSDRIPVDDLVTRESDRAGQSSRKPAGCFGNASIGC